MEDDELTPLSGFGTDMSTDHEAGKLPPSYGRGALVGSLVARLRREPRRSIALLGAAGTGKTALVHAVVREMWLMANGSWRVIRVSPTDIIAGTKYSGEWETKVRRLVEAVRAPKRVV